jgi:hypothetical protein
MLYTEGDRVGKTNVPPPLVVVFDEMPVATWVAVTSAPVTTAPLASVTVPLMLPNPCAVSFPGAQMHTRQTIARPPISLRNALT